MQTPIPAIVFFFLCSLAFAALPAGASEDCVTALSKAMSRTVPVDEANATGRMLFLVGSDNRSPERAVEEARRLLKPLAEIGACPKGEEPVCLVAYTHDLSRRAADCTGDAGAESLKREEAALAAYVLRVHSFEPARNANGYARLATLNPREPSYEAKRDLYAAKAAALDGLLGLTTAEGEPIFIEHEATWGFIELSVSPDFWSAMSASERAGFADVIAHYWESHRVPFEKGEIKADGRTVAVIECRGETSCRGRLAAR